MILRRVVLSMTYAATPSILLRLLVCRVVCLQLSSLLFSTIDRFQVLASETRCLVL